MNCLTYLRLRRQAAWLADQLPRGADQSAHHQWPPKRSRKVAKSQRVGLPPVAALEAVAAMFFAPRAGNPYGAAMRRPAPGAVDPITIVAVQVPRDIRPHVLGYRG